MCSRWCNRHKTCAAKYCLIQPQLCHVSRCNARGWNHCHPLKGFLQVQQKSSPICCYYFNHATPVLHVRIIKFAPTPFKPDAAKLCTLFWHTWPTLHVTCPDSVRARPTLPKTVAACEHLTCSYLSSNTKKVPSANQYKSRIHKAYKQNKPVFKRPHWHREHGRMLQQLRQ